MKCDKLMQDALNLHIDPESRAALNAMRKPAVSGYTPKEGVGIDINSKLMTALNKIKESHTKSIDDDIMFREETIRKLLEREGVSKGEVNASLDTAFKFLKENGSTSADMDKISIDTIIGAARTKQPKIQNRTRDANGYASYTYNKQGLIYEQDYQVRHVLGFDKRVSQEHMDQVKGSYGWARQYIGRQPGIKDDVWRLDEVQSDVFQKPDVLEALKTDLGELGMNYIQLKKMLIVDAIDQAIKHDLDKVVIPITRSTNNLVGSVKVSDAYRDLNTGILPAIRRELDRAGLKLDIKHLKQKETAPINFEDLFGSINIQRQAGLIDDNVFDSFMPILEHFGAMDNFDEIVFDEKALTNALEEYKKVSKDPKSLNIISKVINEQFNPEAFVITIKDTRPKKDTKIRWDALSVLGGLGLAEAYEELQKEES